jgi:hypothetical protein
MEGGGRKILRPAVLRTICGLILKNDGRVANDTWRTV